MSDKFKVIDHDTFEEMQQSTSTKTALHVLKIRNSKYKRMTASNDFSLMHFVKTTQRGKNAKRNVRTRKRVIDTPAAKRLRGKKRENGKKKKPSRLKKSILEYRKKRREQVLIEEQLKKIESDMNDMKVSDCPEDRSRDPSQVEGQLNKIECDLYDMKVSDCPEKRSFHSNTFREYCNCCNTPNLKKLCEQLLRELNYYQRRAYAQNPIKARAHKRFVVGFRQVQAYLHIKKISLVIMATDCERHIGEVSLDETISRIKNECNDQNIPIAFAFRRREMAYIIYKKASISCIGILDYDGAREIFAQLIEALKIAREMYNSLPLDR